MADRVAQVRDALGLDDRRGAQLDRCLRESGEERDALAQQHGHEVHLVRDHHLDHFLAFAGGTGRTADLDAWRARIEGEYDNLRAALEWGLAAADPDRGRRLAAELSWLWHLHWHGHEGIAFLRRAIDRLPADRSLLQARLLTGLALVADTTSPLDLEYDVARQALELATVHGDESLRSQCLTLAAVGRFYTDFAAAWDLTVEAIRSADIAGDQLFRHAQLALQGMIRQLQDRHDEARPLLETALDGLRHRHRGIASTTLAYLSSGALASGRPAEARRLAEQSLELAEPLGDYLRVGIARSALAAAHTASGDVTAALEVMRPLLLMANAEAAVFVPGMGLALAQAQLASGDLDGALRWFERDVRQVEHAAPTYLAAQVHAGYGEALRHAGRYEDARGELDRAAAIARELGMPRVLADVLQQQAHLTGEVDLHHEALAIRVAHGLRTFWVDSLDAIVARLAPPNAVRTLAASSAARAAMGYPRRVAERREYDELVARLRQTLDEGFATAWAAGAEMSLDDAVAYVRRSRGARDRPPAGWDSLTPTELRVARLAAEGLNNPQIGARLFMSRSTVKTHLSHVYAKLGVANRTQLAALATPSSAGVSQGW